MAKRKRDDHSFLLVLANHNPPVFLLHHNPRKATPWQLFVDASATTIHELDCLSSPDADSFTLGGQTITLGSTPGYHRLFQDSKCHLVQVDTLTDVDGPTWLVLETLDGVLSKSDELVAVFGCFYDKLQTLYQRNVAADSIRMPWEVIELDEEITVVPDLNPYMRNQGALILQADCATQKTRHILDMIEQHLRFHPHLRIIFVSCRIVHALDIKSDLDERFPSGSDFEFTIYNDREQGSSERRVVVQLNSINQYTHGTTSYNLVVLDEIFSTLGFFTIGNRTMRSSDKKRVTLTEHATALQQLVLGADKVLLADAHISMDGRVKDFLHGVLRPHTPVTHLILKGKNPACKRTLELQFDNSPGQHVMEAGVADAAAKVLANPEERIFIFSATAKILTQEGRSNGSYEEALRKYGVTKIKIIEGSTGMAEKNDMFTRLDETLSEYQAFLCNGAVTVGVNPNTHFGTILSHTHKKGANISDVFQALQRMGRREGLLSNTTIVMSVNDPSPAEKNAQLMRQALQHGYAEEAEDGTIVLQSGHSLDDLRPTFAVCLRDIRAELEILRTDNDNMLNEAINGTTGMALIHGGITEVPDWIVNVAAWNLLARKRKEFCHVEEILRFAEFHKWDVAISEAPTVSIEALSDAAVGGARSAENDWIVLQKGKIYAKIVPLVERFDLNPAEQWVPRDDDDMPILTDDESAAHRRIRALMSGADVLDPSADTMTMDNKVTEAYFKIYHRFGSCLNPCTQTPFDIDTVNIIWALDDKLAHRATQIHEELLPTQRVADRRKLFDARSKMDAMTKTDSLRTTAFLELKAFLGVPSLVQDTWTLPLRFVDVINDQRNSTTHGDRFDGDEELYNIFRRINPRVKLPSPNKTYNTSALYMDLKKIMKTVAMEPRWDDQSNKPFKRFQLDGDETYLLKAGFGYQPILQDIADSVLAYATAMQSRVPVGSLRECIGALGQPAVESMLQQLSTRCALNFDLNIKNLDNGYVEIFDYAALLALERKINRNESHFRWRYNFKDDKDMSDGSIQKLKRDIQTFKAMPNDGTRGENKVAYHYKFGDGLGRRYANGSSFQNITGGLRKTLAAPFYWDIDFSNSYPTILYHTSTQLGLDAAQIPTFGLLCRSKDDREACLAEIVNFYEVTRDAAKCCLLALCHGGGMDGHDGKGWMNDQEWGISDDVRLKVSRSGHLPRIRSFQVECNRVCKFLLSKYPEFEDILKQFNERLPESKRKTGRMGKFSALSYLMATLEDGLLKNLETFLKSKNYHIDSLEFDGLKPRREGNMGPFPVEHLREAEAYLAGQTLRGGVRIPMKLGEKKLQCPYEL
eukprot:COSAG01_NODE_2495_length_7577_cov_26.851565_4_plen_1323_part_00